jgi:hypothetical protein
MLLTVSRLDMNTTYSPCFDHTLDETSQDSMVRNYLYQTPFDRVLSSCDAWRQLPRNAFSLWQRPFKLPLLFFSSPVPRRRVSRHISQ